MEKNRRVSFCPHCGNRAPQEVVYTQHFLDTYWGVESGKPDEVPSVCHVARCETCSRLLLYEAPEEVAAEQNFNELYLVWPDSGKLHPSVPKSVATIYAEAFKVKAISPASFAVQIRRALEAICDDRGETTGNLESRLRALVSKGELPPNLAEVTEAVRMLGNVAAHAGKGGVHPLQVYALDGFFKAVIEYVYVAPGRLKEFKERLHKLGNIES